MAKSTNLRMAAVQVLVGMALINAADGLNNAGHINWGTVFMYLVGTVCVASGIIDYFSRKK